MEHAVAHNPKVTGAAAARLVAQTTERTLVDRVRNGVLEQVPVRRGAMVGERVAVIGPLAPGDQVLKPGSEELRNNTHVSAKRPEAGAKH
jgi:hypothetical protein